MLMSILTGAIFYDENYKYNAIESGIYNSLHRTVWALGSVGIIYVASYGRSKFIYNVLSWSPLIPLSKLVYGAYLIHMQFQMRAVAKKGGADFVSYFDVVRVDNHNSWKSCTSNCLHFRLVYRYPIWSWPLVPLLCYIWQLRHRFVIFLAFCSLRLCEKHSKRHRQRRRPAGIR